MIHEHGGGGAVGHTFTEPFELLNVCQRCRWERQGRLYHFNIQTYVLPYIVSHYIFSMHSLFSCNLNGRKSFSRRRAENLIGQRSGTFI